LPKKIREAGRGTRYIRGADEQSASPQTGGYGSAVNSNSIRLLNTATVFHAIRERPGVSQARLRDITLIDRSTISTVIWHLEKAGFLLKIKSIPSAGLGRPGAGLRINADSGTLLGIVVRRASTRLVFAGLDGKIHGSEDFESAKTAKDIVALVENHTAKPAGEPMAARAPVVSVGFIDSRNDDEFSAPLNAERFDRFDSLFRNEIRQAIGTPVAFETELNALALAERRFGVMRGVRNFLLAHGAATVSGALFLENQLFRGSLGAAGGIGHVKVVPNGELCVCGGHGCLNAYISEAALLRRLGEFHYRTRSTHIADIVGLQNDALVKTVFSEAGSYLGMALANVANLLNVRDIVLGGHLAVMAENIMPALHDSLKKNVLVSKVGSVNVRRSPFVGSELENASVALALEAFQPLGSALMLDE
jgi:predicted NBD/HSP70 family sugar kinase